MLGCLGIDMAFRVRLMENSQTLRHSRVFAGLTATPGSTVAGETLSGIRRQALDDINPRAKKRTKQSSMKSSSDMDGRVVSMTQKQADRIIRAEVEAMLSRGEPMERMLDPFVRAAFIVRAPAIGAFLPNNADTLYNKFVTIIDMETTLELTKMFNLIPGMLGVAFDGVTANKQCKTLYTVSKGELSMFWTWQDLGEYKTLPCFILLLPLIILLTIFSFLIFPFIYKCRLTRSCHRG